MPSGSDEEARLARATVRARLFGGELPTLSVGRFQLLSQAGSGGMGVVFAAYDPQLDRRVAIKLIKTSGTEAPQRAQRRLLREAQVLARLNHANIVTVHDAGTHEGNVYLAMEWVEGQTLRALTEDGTRPWREVLQIFVEAGRGLAAAHAEGILHRDFKPDNVMRGQDGRVLVLDFGLAIPVSQGTTTDMRAPVRGGDDALTKTGALVGTPRYLSPERLSGESPDPSADQFAFCVSLWAALTGHDPFPLAPLSARHQAMEQQPPERRSGLNVPGWVLDVVARGLQPKPEDRWPSMAVLLDALERDPGRTRRRWALGLGVGALLVAAYGVGSVRDDVCSGSEAELGDAWNQQRRQQAEAAMLGTSLAYAPATWARVEPKLQDYADAWLDEHRRTCEATAVRREQTPEVMERRMACLRRGKEQLGAIATLLEDAEPKTVERAVSLVSGLPPPARCGHAEVLESAIEPPAPEQQAEVESIRAEVSRSVVDLRAGRFAAARTSLQALSTRADDLDYAPLVAEVRLRLGEALERDGHYEDSEKQLSGALRLGLAWKHHEVAQRAATRLIFVVGARLSRYREGLAYAETAWGLAGPSPTVKDEAQLRFEVAQLRSLLGEKERAEQEYRAALGLLENEPDADPLAIAAISSSLAGLLRDRYDFGEAESLLERSLDMQVERLGKEHPNVAQATRSLASVLIGQQRYDEAEQMLRRSLDQFAATAGHEHPVMLEIHIDLARALKHHGKYAEAEHHYRTAIELGTRTLGAQARMVNYARNNLGLALRDQRRYDEAERELRAVYDFRRAELPENHRNTLWTQTILGQVVGSLGRTEEAKTLLEDVIERWAHVEGERCFQIGFASRVLGEALTKGRRWAEAEVALDEALSIHEATVAPDDPLSDPDRAHVALTRMDLARLLHDQGTRPVVAREHAEAMLAYYESAPPSVAKPPILAEARFVAARVLWTRDEDRERARRLIEQAIDGLTDGPAPLREEIEQWRREHP